jgi:hypothetical protein
MTTVRAVKDPEPDPKEGKSRAKSGVAFPYWDLDSSIEVARVIHERAGGSCDLPQLATLLGYSGISNGSFRTRVAAAKMFGVIESTDDNKLRVSSRGRSVVAPVTVADGSKARVEAFMAVDLFKKVFDRFNGTTLPENIGLRNLLQNEYQVVPDRIAPTVRILLDSADQAGLFQMAGNRTRMVMPVGTAPAASPPAPPPVQHQTPHNDHHRHGGSGGSGGSGGGGDVGIDPAILGLLRRLPPGGTPLSKQRRDALIAAFTATVGFIYPDADDGTQ